MVNKLLSVLVSLFIAGTAYAANEISTAGTKISIGTTSVANALSVQSTLAVGSATYTSLAAPSNGAIIQGNVGIGTWKPATLFAVGTSSSGGSATKNAFNIDSNGNITNLGGLQCNINAVTVDLTNGGAAVAMGNASSFAGSGLNLHTGSTTGYIAFSPNNAEQARFNSNGNLGIGTIFPTQKLEVLGNINGYGLHTINDQGGITSAAGINFDPDGGGTLVYLTPGRNVGIGTSNPGVALDVNGAIRATSYSFPAAFVQSANINWSDINAFRTIRQGAINWFDINAAGRLNAGGVNWFDVNGAGKLGSGGVNWTDVNGIQKIKEGAFNFTDVTTANMSTSAHGLAPKGDGNVNHFLTGTGTYATPSVGSATPQGGFNAVQYNHAGSSDGDETKLSFNASNVGIGTTNGMKILHVVGDSYFNGNVGVGSLSPGTAVDVNGVVRATSFSGSASGLTGLPTQWATQNTTDVSLAGGNVGVGTTFTTTAALTVMNGNVGIGTWTTKQALDVKGTAQIGTYAGTSLAAPSNGLIVSGSVGIGTSNPGASLQVGPFTSLSSGFRVDSTGAVTLAGGATYAINANGITMSNSGSFNIKNSSAGSGSSLALTGGANANSNVTIQTSSVTANGGSITFKVGNVGIGTLSAVSIIDGGNVGIGSVAPQSGLTLGGSFHYGSTGTAPTVASNDCGSTSQGTVNAGSTDVRGSTVVGTLTVTSCAITFNKPFGVAPICLTQDDTNILGIKNTQTTTKLTITATTSMSGDTISWICFE